MAQGILIPKDWKGKPLPETLELLQKQVPFEVSFNAVDVGNLRLKSTGEFVDFESFLKRELPLHELTYKQIGLVWVIVKAKKEETYVRMKLLDAETREPIVGVYGLANGRAGSSDSEGYIEVSVRKNVRFAMHLQHLAYEKLDTLLWPKDALMDILMRPATIALEDVTIQNKRYQAPTRIGFKGQTTRVSIRSTDGAPSFGGEKIWGLLKSLPGIYAAYEVPTGFLLKGDLPGQSAIRFENIRCYELEHFLGNISGVMPASLREVSYSSDLPSAKYGDAAGGLLELSGHEIDGDTLFVNAGVNRLMGDVCVGMSLWTGAAVVGGYRKTLRNLFEKGYLHKQNTNKIIQDDIVNTIAPEYSFEDANIKFTQKFGNTEIKLAALMAMDRQSFLSGEAIIQASLNLNDRETTLNRGQSLEMKQLFNKTGRVALLTISHSYLEKENSMRVSYPEYEMFDIEDNEQANSSLEEWFARGSFKEPFGKKVVLELGVEHSYTQLDYSYTWNSILTDEYAHAAKKQSAFLSCNYTPLASTSVTVGIRANQLENYRATDWEPRLEVTHEFTNEWSAFITTGKQSQFFYPVLADKGGSKNQFHWVYSEPNIYPSRYSLHLTSGVQYSSRRFDGSVKGHYRYSPNIIAEAELSQQIRLSDLGTFQADNSQLAYRYRALEFFGRFKSERYSFWVSYILAEATRKQESESGWITLPTVADQRHEIKLAQQFNYGNWHTSLFALWGTGQPIFVSENANTEQVVWRTPNFKRVDFSVFYLWKKSNFETELGITLQNILNETNSKFTTSIYTPSLNTKGFEFYYEMSALPFTVGLDLRIKWHK